MKKQRKAPKLKKGYAFGGVIAPDTLTPEQLQEFNALATDDEKNEYLTLLKSGTVAPNAKANAISALAPAVGNIAASGVDMIDTDPLKKNQQIAQGAGAAALRGAGKGAGIGAAVGSIVPGIGTAIGAGVGAGLGALAGGVAGGIKGKKKFNAAMDEAQEKNRIAAIQGAYTDAGYADGGTIKRGANVMRATTRSVYENMLPYDTRKSHLMLFGGEYADGGDVKKGGASAKKLSPEELELLEKEKRAKKEKPGSTHQNRISGDAMGFEGGGDIAGPGTAKSDDIPARVRKGSFIVPAENAKIAESLRKQYLTKAGGKASLNQGGSASQVWLSNGEHMFTPQEVKVLKAKGIDVDGLAPNAEETGYGYNDGGTIRPSKAREILRDGTANGKPLTEKQKRYFGWIIGRGKKDGGEVESAIPEKKAVNPFYADGGEVDGEDPKATQKEKQAEQEKQAREEQEAQAKLNAADYQNRAEIRKKNIESLKRAIEEAKKTGVVDYTYIKRDNWNDYQARSESKKITNLDGLYNALSAEQESYNNEVAEQKKYAEFKYQPGQAKGAANGKGAANETTTPAPVTTTPAPVTGGGTPRKASESEMTPEMLAYQQAFIKEHGGIGGGTPDVSAMVTTEPRFKAVESDPVDALLKQYNETISAGKDGRDLERQIIDLGGQKKLTDFKSGRLAFDKDGKLIESTTPTGSQKTFIPQDASMQDMESQDAAVDQPAGIPNSPLKRVYESLGPGALLGLGQAGIGLMQAQKAKMPTYAGTKGDPAIEAQYQQAASQQNYGLSPAEYSAAANRIQSQQSNVQRNLANITGGNLGAMVANSRLAAIDTNRANLDLEAADERMRLAKQSRTDNLAAMVAQDRNRQFAQNMTVFGQQQAASAGLINAGIENMVGSIMSIQNQNRIDDRMAKYGQVNFTLSPTGS